MSIVTRKPWLFGIVKDGLIIYTSAGPADTFDPSWAFSAGGGPMTVDWGDGTPKESHATGLSHTYATAGRKAAEFTCPNWAKVTNFDVNADICRQELPSFARLTALVYWNGYTNQFSGVLPSFAACTALTNWIGYTNQFSGTLPSFAACTALAYWQGNTNQFSGVLPSFAACTALTNWLGYTNQFSGYTAGGFATQKNLAILRLETNLLPVASIDAILADCVTSLGISGRVVCTLNLSGTGNATPSAQGLIDKATLVAAGWTVTTN